MRIQAAYEPAFHPDIAKDLKGLDRHIRQRILDKIQWLLEHVEETQHKPLTAQSEESMSNSGGNLAPDSANTQCDLPKDFAIFLDFFVQATAMVGEDYFRLPVAGREDLLYRERVYCYELYHCLRLTMEHSDPSFPYTLCGELDKSGHPCIRGNSLDRVKPDFLVHKPLSMTLNLVAIEVKPVARTIRGGNQTGVVGWRAIGQKEIEKDLKTLTAFHRDGSYHRAIYLIYGNDDRRFQHIRAKAAVLSDRLGTEEIDLDLIDLYLHQESGQPASRQAWL